MAEAPPRYVCDQAMVMRIRLLCGLYSRRAVPPRWRPLAQAYCITVPVAISFFLYITRGLRTDPAYLILLPSYGVYYISVFISLWAGDEYIYTFFTQDKLTDITLDSPKIFSRLQKHIKRCFIYLFLYYTINIGLYVAMYYKYVLVLFFSIIPSIVIDMVINIQNSTKLLVLSLFDARLLVLKRRLQRHGFRSAGRARPQLCGVYHQIMQGIDDTDNPLKLLISLDWISSCCKIIYIHVYYLFTMEWMEGAYIQVLEFVMSVTFVLMTSFGHIALLESAAAHCEEMAVFTVTQLIKTPTVKERRRMLSFLAALEQRGARYHELRALPLNARLVLSALSIFSAQIIFFVTHITK